MLVALWQGTTTAVARAARLALVGMPKVYARHRDVVGPFLKNEMRELLGNFPICVACKFKLYGKTKLTSNDTPRPSMAGQYESACPVHSRAAFSLTVM